MSHETDVIGFIKYFGDQVPAGIIDAKSAGTALIGLDEAVRFFNEKQSPEFARLEYEIPVQTQEGSWMALLLAPIAVVGYSYLKKAGEKMAENDFKDTGLKDAFKKSLSALQHLVKLVKHTGMLSGWDMTTILWRNQNTEAGIPNSQGEILYVPAEFLGWYSSAPIGLVRRITVVIRSERTLSIGIKNGYKFDEVTVSESEKELFNGVQPMEDDEELLFPELEHGRPVKLEGKLIRGNEAANSMGLEYKGHVLNCIPNAGNVRRFKSALFLRCIVEGVVTRLAKQHTIAEKRPTIILHKVTPLEHDDQHALF